MTRKIKFLIVALFFTGLLLLFSSNKSYADEVTVQVTPLSPTPISDTSTVTSSITIQSVENKVTTAQGTLNNASQVQGNAIIQTIQSNVPNTDTSTAVSIAITQEPIKTAVESATAVIQLANTAIQSAQTAISVAVIAQANVETQTATVQTNQVILTAETSKLPDLQTTQTNTQSGFYTENSNLGTATSNVSTAETAVSNAITNLANSEPITTTTNGISATTYAYSGSTASPLPNSQTVPLSTTTVASLSNNWGSGQVLNSGRVDNVVVKFEGTITLPEEAVIVRYNTYADDGTKLYIDGVLAVDNWRDQSPRYSNYSQDFNVSVDKQQDFVLWYYEHGGGAVVNLGWVIIRADGTGYFTFPQAEAFSSVIKTPDPIKVAAVDTAKTNLTSVKTAYDTQLAIRDAAYQAWQDAIHAVNAQQSVIDSAQAAYDIAQANLLAAQQSATAAIQTADALANTATAKVDEAVNAMTNAAQVAQDYYAKIAADKAAADAILAAQQKAAAEARAARAAELAAQAEANRIAAEKSIADAKIAQEKAAAEAKAAEDARIVAEQAAKDAQAAADKAKADAEIQAAKDAQAAADAAKAEADAKAKAEQDAALAEQKAKDEAAKLAQDVANAKAEADKQKAEADKIAAEQAVKEQQAKDTKAAQDAAIQAQKDAQAKADAAKAEEDKAAQQAANEKAAADKALIASTGVVPNNPAQLPTDIPKPAPAEVLVPHIQVDVKGVENGGIQFFGTQSAPQVVGEDGHLTPPAPPPGSGLPIPADAITTADTFIGQPGGASFNAPDVAVPVVLTPVTGALASVPGVQAINQAFVAMANIGNDMSPVTRKKAKKILVTTVVVGQIVALRRRFGK